MAKSVFYSFHYDRDVMRVQQVRNIWAIQGQPLLEPQDWESVKGRGKQAIKDWIADKMSGVDAVVVLIGAQTSTRDWVKYEIAYAWNNHLPLVGVHIHGLADPRTGTDYKGQDPFWEMRDDKLGVMGQYLNTFDPTGANGSETFRNLERYMGYYVEQARPGQG